MMAKEKRPSGGAYTGTDTKTEFHDMNYNISSVGTQEENSPVREIALPEQASGNSELVLLPATNAGRLPHTHFSTGAGGRQDYTQRNFAIGDVFQRAKDAVTVPEAATFYGYAPNRAGFIRCPFHGGGNEKTPSCHLNERFFKCFACQESGDVVKFTAKLFDLSPLDALKKLDTDFNIGLSLDRHAPTAAELEAARKRQEERDARRRFENWRRRAIWALSTAAGVGEAALRDKAPEQWTESEVLAIKRRDFWDYIAERLQDGDEAERVSILREWPVIGRDVAKGVGVNG